MSAVRRVAAITTDFTCRAVGRRIVVRTARFFLRDAFEFLFGLGYRVGKLTPRGVESCPGWDADLETFVEGNYLAREPTAATLLPAATW
jgi:hypothetical protein